MFDHTWLRLAEPEREALRRLSVLWGSFSHEAAEAVAGATLAIQATLVDQALLQTQGEDRYHLHELLRQFAAERLGDSPDEAVRARDDHSAYYTGLLAQRRADIDGDRQRETVKEIYADLENIRAAWGWAVAQLRVEALQASAYTWYAFHDLQGRYREGADTFEKLAHALEAAPPGRQRDILLAEILVYVGWMGLRLGRLEKARAALNRSRALYATANAIPPPVIGGDPLTALSVLAHVEGRLSEAIELADEARRLSEARADKHNLTIALYALSGAAFGQGQYEAARQYAERALATAEELHCRWFGAYCLIELGNVARAQGDLQRAKAHYQTSEAIRRELADPEGIAVALRHLGWVAVLQADYPEAQRLFEESLDLYREIGDQGGLAATLTGLGQVALGLANTDAARQHFSEALHVATEARLTPYTLSTLVGIAELMLKMGQPQRSLELLALALQHPASDRETRERVEQFLDQHRSRLALDALGEAALRGVKTADVLDATLAVLQAELAPLPGETRPAPSELLTARELQILRFIAGGLSNQEIAQRLVMSVGTIKWYTGQIYRKLDVRGRTQAIARARELKLLP